MKWGNYDRFIGVVTSFTASIFLSLSVYNITDWHRCQDKQFQQINTALISLCVSLASAHITGLPKSVHAHKPLMNKHISENEMWDFLSIYVYIFLPAFLLSSSLCLTWLQKGIWFLFALEGLDDFNARKRKAALNCDEISVSCKYEPLEHDLLVIANVSLLHLQWPLRVI